MNKWVLEKIKLKISLEAKIKQLKLSYFGHIMRRQGSLEKIILLGKIEGRTKKVTPNMRWIDSIKEVIGMSLQELSRDIEHRRLWISLIHHSGLPGVRANSVTCNTHNN